MAHWFETLDVADVLVTAQSHFDLVMGSGPYSGEQLSAAWLQAVRLALREVTR